VVRDHLPLEKAAESARGFWRMFQTAYLPRLPCRGGIVLVSRQLAFDRFEHHGGVVFVDIYKSNGYRGALERVVNS
jgi:hypothetical protein